jgi:acyl transferase domain-containing protein
LSASSSAALVASAAQFATYLDSGHTPLDDVCFTAAVRRSHLEHRAAVVGSSREELATACRELAEAGQIGASRPHRVVFAFSGQSPVWEGMGRELLASVPAFKDAVEACDAVFEPLAGWSLMDRLHREGRSADLEQIDVAQPMIFAFQIGVAAVWKAWGITPDIVFGQSMGEVAAACVAGWLDLTDAARVIYHRSRLLRSTSGRGRTAVIGLGPAQARLALAGFDGVLSVAGSTSSTATAISGEPAALDELLARLAAQEVFCRRLNNVDTAAHSPQMDSLKPQLEAELAGIAPRAGEVAFMSTVTADYVDGCPLDGTYWANNLREPFRVGEAVQRLLQEGVCAFVEISPQPVLLTALRQSIAEISRDSVAVASTNRDAGELEALLRSLCELYGAGCDPDWRAVIGREGRCVSLPPYPWQRERYWYDQLDRDQGAKSGTRPVEGAHPLLGVEFASALPSGEQFREVSLSVDSLHYLRDHAVGGVAVLPAAAYLEMALAVCGIERVLEDVRFEQVLTLPEGEARRLQFVLRPGSRTADFQVYSRSATGPSTWVLHSAGTAGIAPGGEGGSVAALYALVRSRGSTGPLSPIHPDEHYRAMQSRGLVYGESFRSIRELWRGDACAVVRVELAADTFSDAYCIHPALLDGCFQAVAAAAPDDGGTLYGTGVYLPSGVRHLRLTRHAPASVWCAVQMSGPTGGPRLEADLALFADDGALVADIRGLELRRLDAAADDKPGYYAVDWLERHLQGEVTTGRWLLVGDGEGLATELSERLEARGCQWRKLEVHSGGVEEALGGVLGETNWDGVAFLHGVGCTGESVAGVLSTLLATVRAIASQASPGKPRLFVVTRGAQLVAGTERDGAVAEACLWGFGRALAVEHPEFWGGLVDLGGDDADGESLCGELLASDGEDQVGYRSGRRYVARLVRSRLQGSRPLRIRTDGAYLVTGGLSGLGLEAARWLAGRGARRLILVGRTGMPTREEWNGLDASSRLGLAAAGIRELERTGAAVHTAAVDVGREGALQSYVESYRAKGYPPIVGIVHAAGVLCDELAMRMSDAVLEQALAPKLYGGMEIDRIARDPSVELVVLYSSATGVLGQLGQVNYGAGNAYLDALARRRDGDRQRWLSVAWGPWAEVGLFARERLDEKAGLTGVTPLTPREGLAALVAAIESNEAEVLVVRADWSKSRRRIVSDLAAGPAPSGGDEGANASLVLELLLAEPEQRRRRLEEWLRDRVARVLRTEAARVATARPLVALGIDSLMAVELRNGIDGELGLGLALVDLFTGTIQDLAIRLDQMVESDTRLAQLRDRDRLDELLADLVPAEREVGDGEAG